MKAILVAIKLKDNNHFEETLAECRNLCDAAELQICQTIIQASESMDPKTALRRGKLEEVRQILQEQECSLVVFYNNLNTAVIANIRDELHVDVLDRTGLILNIFSLRARSKEAQLQTEIAMLKYNLPQLLKSNMDSDKQRGGTFNNRGAGETRGTIIRRRMEGRIGELKKELKKLESRKENEYQKRNRSELKKVALVGYTNAGKSSLMNILLKRNERPDKQVLEKDQLFATLDTSVRRINYKKREFLLFDTVGFVSDLPHELVEAFKSTLKAANHADLLIHVIDRSNPDYLLQQQITLDTLKQIGADHIPVLNVYNKADLIKMEEPDELLISCKENTGIDELLEKVDQMLYPLRETETLLIGYDRLNLLDKYRQSADFTILENKENGSLVQIEATPQVLMQIKKELNKEAAVNDVIMNELKGE